MSRIVLKISGEALKDNETVSNNKLKMIYETINILKSDNHHIAIVIGGGNLFRGREHEEMNSVTADTIGMLASVMNALYLHDYLESKSTPSIVVTPFNFPDLVPNYTNEEIMNLSNDHIIIFGGGIGKSGYSTDSGVVLASDKIKADLIIKMTNVDGVYDSDPRKNPNAHKYTTLTYDEVINNNLQVMDLNAVLDCKEKKRQIIVMNFQEYFKILDILKGESIGTIIKE